MVKNGHKKRKTENNQITQDREIAGVKIDIAQLRAHDEVKANEIEKLKQENTAKDKEIAELKARLNKIEKISGSK